MPLFNKDIITKNIKTLSRKDNWNKVLMFLFFLIVSAGFWVLQTLQQMTDATFSIPITYTNKSDLIAFKDTLPHSLTVKVLDKGISLLNYSVNSKGQSIEIDLEPLSETNPDYIISAQHLEAACQKILPTTSVLVSHTPVTLSIHAFPLKEKLVPVFFNGEIVPAKGFMLTDKIQLSPETITVYGSQQVIDTLTGIYIQEIHSEGVDESTSYPVKLAPPVHIFPQTSTVNLRITVEECTEKTLEVPIQAKNFPEKYRLRTFPPSVKVVCRLPLSQYSAVNSTLFEASVFYSDSMSDSTSTIPVSITKKPEWISEIRYNPEKVEYLLEQYQNNDLEQLQDND